MKMLILLPLALLAGCMQIDGRWHTLCTGLQVDRAIARAQGEGAVRAYTPSGRAVYLRGAAAERYRQAREEGAPPEVGLFEGESATQLREEYYPAWLRALAWTGDALTWSGLTLGLTRVAQEASAASEGPPASSAHNTLVVSGSGNQIILSDTAGGDVDANTGARGLEGEMP